MSTSAERLTRTIRWLQVYAALMTVALAVLFVRSGTAADRVLRARGLIEDYSHETTGMLILSENGFDRLVVGDPVPDPNIGRRIAPSTGMVINDAEGFERMGYGLKPVDGRYRVSLGLDTDRIQEGLLLALDDDGLLGVTVGTGANGIFLGSAPAGHGWTGLAEEFQGLLVRRDGEIVHKLNLADGN